MKVFEHLSFEPYVDQGVEVGSVIKVENGDAYLVGDLNGLLGWCDDCPMKEKIVEIAHIKQLLPMWD